MIIIYLDAARRGRREGRGRKQPMAKPETAAAGRKPAEKQGEEAPLVEREVRGALTVLTMTYRPYNLVGPKLMRVLLAALAPAHEAGRRELVLRICLCPFHAVADPDHLIRKRCG